MVKRLYTKDIVPDEVPKNKLKNRMPYKVLVRHVISLITFKQRKGASMRAVSKYIRERYVVGDRVRKYVWKALKENEEEGLLTREKMSFKLTNSEKIKIRKSYKMKERMLGKKKLKTKAKKKKSKKKSKKISRTRRTKKVDYTETPDDFEEENIFSGGNVIEDSEDRGRPKSDFIWQFQHGEWYNYDISASDEVERTYQIWRKESHLNIDVRAVKSGQWNYMIDFRNNYQQNIDHDAHTKRKIRRVPWRGNEDKFKTWF